MPLGAFGTLNISQRVRVAQNGFFCSEEKYKTLKKTLQNMTHWPNSSSS